MKFTNLNENENKALEAIVSTCEDLDGDLFTRLDDAIDAVAEMISGNPESREARFSAGAYITDLLKKGYIDEEPDDIHGMGIWVSIY